VMESILLRTEAVLLGYMMEVEAGFLVC